jgi:sugar (pentulose or hexulose) kinase
MPTSLPHHRQPARLLLCGRAVALAVGSPFGAAILAGMGAGVFPDVRKSLVEMVHLDRRFEPNQANHEKYSEIYRVFRNIYEHLKGDFDDAAAITP